VRRRLLVLAAQVATAVALVGLWQLAVGSGWVSSFYVSRPSSVATALWHGLVDGRLLRALEVTLKETLIGFAIAIGAGTVVAFAFYQLPVLNQVARPFVTAANNLPRLALMPLFVLWFGFGSNSRIAVVVSLAFFVVLISTHAGLASADPDQLRLARVLGASPLQRLRLFVAPSALPAFFGGLQLGLTYSFLGAVVGEMLAGSGGLGSDIQLSLATYRAADFFAAIAVVAAAATVLSGALHTLERRLLAWRVVAEA